MLRFGRRLRTMASLLAKLGLCRPCSQAPSDAPPLSPALALTTPRSW